MNEESSPQDRIVIDSIAVDPFTIDSLHARIHVRARDRQRLGIDKSGRPKPILPL